MNGKNFDYHKMPMEQEDSLHIADKLNEYLSAELEFSAKSSQKIVNFAI